MTRSNGIHFVKIVASPLNGWRDCTAQFNRAYTLPDMVRAVLDDWYGPEAEAEDREEAIDMALNMVQAQFSHIDHDRVRPMTEEIDLQDLAFNISLGLGPDRDGDECLGIGLKPPHRMYELRPQTLCYDDILERLPFAERHGHHTGIGRDELWKAKSALEEAQGVLLQGCRNFRDFPAMPSFIMSGAQMAASCHEDREDILLNTLFGHTDNFSARLNALSPLTTSSAKLRP